MVLSCRYLLVAENLYCRIKKGAETLETEKVLLNVEETAKYLNLGITKTREIMKANEGTFVLRIGRRQYAHKILLDRWLVGQVRK